MGDFNLLAVRGKLPLPLLQPLLLLLLNLNYLSFGIFLPLEVLLLLAQQGSLFAHLEVLQLALGQILVFLPFLLLLLLNFTLDVPDDERPELSLFVFRLQAVDLRFTHLLSLDFLAGILRARRDALKCLVLLSCRGFVRLMGSRCGFWLFHLPSNAVRRLVVLFEGFARFAHLRGPVL